MGKCKDLIHLYDTQNWQCKFVFKAEIDNINDVKFVGDDRTVMAWGIAEKSRSVIHIYQISKQVKLVAEILIDERQGIN